MNKNHLFTTTLTNPGIIDRLEQDIADYLAPHGFRLERRGLEQSREQETQIISQKDGAAGRHVVERKTNTGGSCAKSSSSSGSGSIRADLVIPCLPYDFYSTTNNNNGGAGSNLTIPNNNKQTTKIHNDIANVNVTSTAAATTIVGPLGTLHLHIHQESLLPTVGPLLRTFLRISPHYIPPRRLRSVIHCHFVVDALEKIHKMNAEQRRTQLGRQEELAARRMAHHLHMLVRNSMGMALCLDLVVVLPKHRRRRLDEGEGEAIENKGSTAPRLQVPIPSESVRLAMEGNPDACYPSVQLVDQPEVDTYDDADNGSYASTKEIYLDVRTRMCTVRHQPLLFRWISSLQYSPTADENGDGAKLPCTNDRVDFCNNQQLPKEANPKPLNEMCGKMPLVIACIEKVGNLHRILMLCHDYGKIRCLDMSKSKGYQNDEEKSHSYSTTSLLSNVVVIIPNINSNGEEPDNKTLREFENAVDHFHKVIIDPNTDNNDGQQYRPAFVYEEDASEKISNVIMQQRQSDSAHSLPLSPPSIVGIDLHPEALTLHGDYHVNSASPALQKMRMADAIIFGYESTGIPESIANELNGWVQIPCRSSINVVAAMSIVLDALLGAGTGAETKLNES